MATRPADYAALRSPADRWNGWTIPEGGLEPPATLRMLENWCARLMSAQGWGTWLAIADGELVASLAVKEPMADAAVEIGYAVAPARRGRGMATAAVLALCRELVLHGVRTVRAETAKDNPASGGVMANCGFRRVGERTDPDDGELVLWEWKPA